MLVAARAGAVVPVVVRAGARAEGAAVQGSAVAQRVEAGPGAASAQVPDLPGAEKRVQQEPQAGAAIRQPDERVKAM